MFDLNQSKSNTNPYPYPYLTDTFIGINKIHHVEDIIKSLEGVMKNPIISGETFNEILKNREVTFYSILEKINPDYELEYLKNKAKFSNEVKNYLLENKLTLEVLVKIISKTIEILSDVYYDRFKIKIDLNYDYEILDLEELIVTIYIMEQNFDNLIQEWEKIGELTKKIFTSIKFGLSNEKKLLYDNINSKLIISVQEWEYESI